MNAGEIAALCTGIPAIIGAITALITALKANATAKKANARVNAHVVGTDTPHNDRALLLVQAVER